MASPILDDFKNPLSLKYIRHKRFAQISFVLAILIALLCTIVMNTHSPDELATALNLSNSEQSRTLMFTLMGIGFAAFILSIVLYAIYRKNTKTS